MFLHFTLGHFHGEVYDPNLTSISSDLLHDIRDGIQIFKVTYLMFSKLLPFASDILN